jgi:hypothetical protein
VRLTGGVIHAALTVRLAFNNTGGGISLPSLLLTFEVVLWALLIILMD